jgi:hypothetical protein
MEPDRKWDRPYPRHVQKEETKRFAKSRSSFKILKINFLSDGLEDVAGPVNMGWRRPRLERRVERH